MSDSEKLKNCKIEIRSILIPYQKGCYLSNFLKTYRDLIGRKLPAAEFGFRTDIDFLYSMPDVVRITPFGRDFHLQGIADETVKHIQKMVAKQKPAKLKGPPLPRFGRSTSRFFTLPPRFIESKSVPEPRFSLSVPKEPKLPQTSVSKEPKLPQTSVPKETKLPPTETNNTELPKKLSPKDEVILLVQKHKNGLALDDLLVEYKRMYNKNLSLSLYGLSSIEECVDFIDELSIIRKNNVDFVVYCSELQQSPGNEAQNIYTDHSGVSKDRIHTPEMPSTFNSDNNGNESCYEGNVSTSLRKKFQKVADSFSDGISASDFPQYFEKVTSESLDFYSLGYRCLGDLIDDVPDIFVRKPVAGSRKDYFIYPAKSEVAGPSFVDHIVLNFKKILEAYPEGLKIKDILNIYSINCKDTLHIEDLGFADIEAFLSSIRNSIPLKFSLIDGEKSVHLKHSCANEDVYRESETLINEAIPFDALFPEFVKFKPLTLPANFDFNTFVPVYVSSVSHPGHMYIQFKPEDDFEQSFEEVSKDIETFYNGSQSESYTIRNIHIKVGACCVAKWPVDGHWYRAQILSMPSVNSVKVIYVDYGTTDTIPTYLLRYIKKEFIALPVQALKCRLSYIRPPNNAEKWNIQVRSRILSLCQDIALMAKFEREFDGVYSIILCDTNGDDDIYINDVLCEEGLAECVPPTTNENTYVSPEPKIQMEYHHKLGALEALQAQYFLKAFAAVAPTFAQNEHYLILLQQVSMYCQTTDVTQQNVSMPIKPPVGPPGFNPIPQNLKPYGNPNAFSSSTYPAGTTLEANLKPYGNPNTFSSSTYPAGTTLEGNLKPYGIPNAFSSTYPAGTTLEETSVRTNVPHSVISTADHVIKAPTDQNLFNFTRSTENATYEDRELDNDIFDDDDDEEMFRQFCQKATLSNIRYVKRVILSDGYRIHIIVVESTPYASSGDVSQLIWNNREADYLYRRLEQKEVDIPAISLSEDGNEVLFEQLKRFNVKGVQNTTGFKSSILLFPLKNVIKILNIFGHPSVTLRTRLTEEIANFNPNDPYWQDFSLDAAELEDEDSSAGVTDDDKIGRLCLYDLLAMHESIMFKKKKILNNTSSSQKEEISKLELLQRRVAQRIQEIQQICQESGLEE